MGEFVSEEHAVKEGLIQLTEIAYHTPKEEIYLKKEIARIVQDKSRKAVIVKKGIYLALWVDDAAERLSRIKFGGGNGV